MCNTGMIDRISRAAQTVFLIAALGVLFGAPLRAAPAIEQTTFVIEIDLGAQHEWVVRANGPVRVNEDGTFAWPFWQEGFARISSATFTHRRVGSSEPRVQQLSRADETGNGIPSPKALGYGPGEIVEIGLLQRIKPLAGGGLDQAFAFPKISAGIPVLVEILGLRPNIRMQHVGLKALAGKTEGMQLRQTFEPEKWRAGASVLHDFSKAPRLFISTHADYRDLGRAMASDLREPDRAIVEGALRFAPADAPLDRLAEVFLAAARAGSGSALERAVNLRAMLQSRGLAAEITFTNRRPILEPPQVPVGLFDAVLVALPNNGVMLDPAVSPGDGAKFDPELAGRDTLRLAPDGGRLEKIPLGSAKSNRIFVRADIQINRDGTVEGQSLTEAHGLASVKLQQLLAKLRSAPAEGGITRLLQQQSLEGEARLGPTEQREDTVGQHLSFRFAPINGEDTVTRVQAIPGPRLFRPPFVDMVPALQSRDIAVVPCQAVTVEHQIVMHLPDRRMLVEQPADMSVVVGMGSYKVSYEIEVTRIIVRRKLEFEPGRAFCTREQVLEMAPLIRATSRDIARSLHLRLPAG